MGGPNQKREYPIKIPKVVRENLKNLEPAEGENHKILPLRPGYGLFGPDGKLVSTHETEMAAKKALAERIRRGNG